MGKSNQQVLRRLRAMNVDMSIKVKDGEDEMIYSPPSDNFELEVGDRVFAGKFLESKHDKEFNPHSSSIRETTMFKAIKEVSDALNKRGLAKFYILQKQHNEFDGKKFRENDKKKKAFMKSLYSQCFQEGASDLLIMARKGDATLVIALELKTREDDQRRSQKEYEKKCKHANVKYEILKMEALDAEIEAELPRRMAQRDGKKVIHSTAEAHRLLKNQVKHKFILLLDKFFILEYSLESHTMQMFLKSIWHGEEEKVTAQKTAPFSFAPNTIGGSSFQSRKKIESGINGQQALPLEKINGKNRYL